MENPWLDIPLADYEAHMALPEVGQAELLAATLQWALEHFRPRSLLVPGVAGGNGLDRVDTTIVERVVALDIHPGFLDLCTQRHGSRFTVYEAVLHDLDQGPPRIAPVEAIVAGLVLEYVEVPAFCTCLSAMLVPGGTFTVLLQRPAAHLPEVTPSPYTRLAGLARGFRFVDPDALDALLVAAGFSRITMDHPGLPSGKRFFRAAYRRVDPVGIPPGKKADTIEQEGETDVFHQRGTGCQRGRVVRIHEASPSAGTHPKHA